ncbi:MAG: S9 family peptidase [Bacteroidota bacterium]|nr:S9 family peptidase [Bacteroidota bacterium]
MMKKFVYAGVFLFFFSACTFNKKEEPPTSLTKEEIAGGKLTPEILWKFGRVGDSQLSPDGKTVVYTVTRYNVKTNKSNCDIFSVSTGDKTVTQLTDFEGNEYNPRWYPDGSRIGFLRDKNGSTEIWEMKPDGSKKTRVTRVDGGINGFEYSPQGDHLYFLKNVKLDTTANEKYPDLPLANVRIINDMMYRHWNSWSDYTYSHIFVADYKKGKIGEPKDIMKDEHWDSPLAPYFDNSEINWSPDGKFIAYTCKKLRGRAYALSTNSDIYLYNIETGKVQNLTEGMNGYDRYPVFSPDSKYIAWQSMKTPGYESDKQRLFICNLATGEKTDLTANFDNNAANFCWTKDGSKIYFISGINATFQVFCADVAKKEIKQVTTGVHDYTSLHLSGNTLVGERMSMSMATEIFKINPANGNETQLTFTNKNIYDNIKMGKVEGRWITTTDHKKMLVWIIYPPKFDPHKKYPAILYCEGGPQDPVSQFFSYRWNFQIMAANDYIVIAPNRRGLPTFGQAWNDEITGDYGGQNMKDYLSSVDAMKKEPFVDGDHIGAVGASYGAYSVYWLAGHHQKRFKAFIAHCGIFNLESQYAETEELWFPNHDLGGPYWKSPKPKSYEFSPHKFVQNWDTPIMIITGGNDFRIPYTENLQAFDAAQLRGIPSKLLFFPDESHWVMKPQNSILWQREFFGWLDKWLKKK